MIDRCDRCECCGSCEAECVFDTVAPARVAPAPRVRAILEENGCECECDHHPDERGPDCEVCLACRIGEAVGK